jgi:hypothetical protein
MEESPVTTDEQNIDDTNNFSQETPFRKPRTEQCGIRQSKLDEFQLRIIKALEEGNLPNRHLSFFKEVIPFLENSNEEETLEFQMGVLQFLLILNTENQVNFPVSLFQSTTSQFILHHMLGEIIQY